MTVEIITPKDEAEWLQLRTKDITSTEVSALFGLSPYTTEFELWHRKKTGEVPAFTETDRMKWGTRLQDAIANGIAEDQGWTVRRMDEYMRDPELRLGASFDFDIEVLMTATEIEISKKEKRPPNLNGLLEIKNVDSLIFKQGWEIGDDGQIEAPPHIELQIQQQMMVSGRKFGYLGALVGGNTVTLLKREADDEIFSAIKEKVEKFWLTIEADQAPEIDFERDAKFVSKLYGYAEPGKVMDLTGNTEFNALAERHRVLGAAIKDCTKERDGLKAQMLMVIGDAEKCTADGCSVSAGLIGPTHVEFDKAGYRNFRLNWPRKKK